MKDMTKLAHKGRDGTDAGGGANPPIQRASTILFERAEDLYGNKLPRDYATDGMVVHDSLKEAVNALEGAIQTILTPTGLAACTLPLLTFCKAGDHILLSDNIYGPTRKFAMTQLVRFGIETSFFDPRADEAITRNFRDNTRAVFFEAPGSLTMEIGNVPLMAKLAKAKGIFTLMDNTWAAGWYFKPLENHIDVSVHAATKYPGGHSDALMGFVSAKDGKIARALRKYDQASGNMVSADDAWLVLRGLRSMGVRLAQHEASALKIARWLEEQPAVQQMLHPALPSHPDHEQWQSDFTGACGLFSFVIHETNEKKVLEFLDRLKLFGLGFSWGGYESLAIHCDPQIVRPAGSWKDTGTLIRLSIGLEDPDDLIADLAQALAGIG